MPKKRYKVTGVPQPQNNGEPKGRKKERFVEGTYDPNEMAGYMMEEQEVVVPGQASAWGKARRAYKEKNPEEEFVEKKKRQYLALHPGLNRMAGLSMSNFPADVEQNFRDEYRYKTNTAVVKKVSKQEGWNPNDRKQYIDDLNETQRQIVANSKYGNKLQANYWDRALAGIGTLVAPFSSGVQRMMNEGYMPGLTKKESREILNRKIAGIPIGGAEVVTPFLQSIGQNVANTAKNTGLSYGSDYKQIPGLGSGYSMPNVSEKDAIALDPFTYIGLPEGIAALGRGALNLGKGAVNLGKAGVNAAKRYGYGQDLSNFRFTDEASDFLRAEDFRPQSASNSTPAPKPKGIDTTVPLYRVEPQGSQYPSSTNKYADAYNDYYYGRVDELSEEELAKILDEDPQAVVYTDADGVQKVGSFYPQHTEGNWWSSVPMGTPESPQAVSTFLHEGPIAELTTQVPYSQLNRFKATNDPLARGFVGKEDLEYILPPEYRQKATVVDQSTRKPLNLDEAINNENVTAVSTEINPEIKSIFENKPEIEKIGSIDEYDQYIKEAYPEHSMLFHGTESEVPFDEFKPNILGTHTGSKEQAWWRLDEDAWFDKLNDTSLIPEELRPQIFPVVVNSKEYIKGRDYIDAENLVGDKTGKLTEKIYDEIYNVKSEADDEMRKLAITFYYDGTLTKEQAKKLIKTNDIGYVKDITGKKGYFYENRVEAPGQISYVSFDPSDVTKLGSKKDIEGFKQWKKSKSAGASQESTSNVKRKKSSANLTEARKAFEEDLKNDPDFIAFRENAIIPESQKTRRLNDSYDIDGKVYDSYGYPIATRDYKNLRTSSENISGIAPDPSNSDLAKAFNQVENEAENERIAQNIDEFVMRKMDLWDTPEGERRLQNMIDNSPGLAGQTPETLKEKLFELANVNFEYAQEANTNAAIAAEMDQLEILYNEGKISLQDYRDRFSELDDALAVSDTRMSNVENALKSGAFYSHPANAIGIKPNVFNYDEIRNAVAHEFGHFTTSGGGTTEQISNLDNQLAKLDLIDDVSEQLIIPGLEKSQGAYSSFGPGKGPGYLKKAKTYFESGSRGTERVPFIAEVREAMLKDGVLQHEYDKITPKILKDYYNKYKNTQGPKYPLRLLDIVKNKPENFNIMSEVLNNLPMIAAGTALAYNELNNDTDEETPITEASMLGLIGLLAKKPGTFTMPKKLQGIVNQFNKYGNAALKELKGTNIKYVKNQIKKLEKEMVDIATEVGNRQEGLTKDLDVLETKVWDRRKKFRKFLDKRDKKINAPMDINTWPFNNPFAPSRSALESAVENKIKQVAAYNEAANAYQIKPENTIATKDTSLFEGVTTTGTKPVTDLSTGQTVNAEVRLPGYIQEYKVVDGELVKTDWNVDKPIISQEYVTALKNSRNDVETKIPGAKVFGSSVLVTDAGMPHITGDIDVLITQSDYDKNVKGIYDFVQDYGPAKQHNVYPNYGEEGVLDFNIIHEDANGMVVPFDNPMTFGKTPMEIELFRQFYPKQFQEASIESMLTGKPIQINMSSKDFIAGIDPQVKTVIDSYEASPFTKWGMYNSKKEKHILRPDILIAYGDPEVVAKGQLAYIQSIVGENGTLGHQFAKEDLSDIHKNVDALIKMDFQGDVLQTAADPERMQLALNDYYINHTVFSREISAQSLPGNMYTQPLVKAALTEWQPGMGGSFHGIGLNTVQKGNPTHIDQSFNPVIGHRQLGLKLDTSDPLSYVESIVKGTSGNYYFTPEETKILQDLIDKYIPEVKTQIPTNVRSRDILDLNPYSNFQNSKQFLEELSKETGIRAIRKEEDSIGGYGSAQAQYASLLDKYDELADAMMYSLKEYHAAPKTFAERKRAMQGIKKNSPSSSFRIQTKKDFNKLYAILNGGLQTAQARLSQITNELSNLNDYKDNLIKGMSNEDDIALEKLAKKIEDLEKRQSDIKYYEVPRLKQKIQNLKGFYKVVGLGSLGGGIVVAGTKAYQYEEDRRSKEYKKDYQNYLERGFEEAKGVLKARGLDINKYNPKVTKDPQLQALLGILKENPWAQEWPNGEPVEFKNGKIVKPKGLIKKTVYDNTVYILEKPKPINKKQFGGQNTIEMELTPEEIQEYVSKGYVVIEE